MNISYLFFTFLSVLLLGIAVALCNFRSVFKRCDMTSRNVTAHFLAIFLIVVGKIGAIVTGIIWLVTYLKHT